jgi:Zn finger protein HypA/HybF involved in hydrogenase expression
MAIYISRNPQTVLLAATVGARTAVGSFGRDLFEAEGECRDCGHVGDMYFSEIDAETAVAECPKCGWGVRKYTGPDA